ncbi:hypothetical protein [Dakarella massiliensis]|uniref:hypothetical protein n=1 Tax=Dakarella massiliensis TaxID=1506471 RepID=UPI0038B2C763
MTFRSTLSNEHLFKYSIVVAINYLLTLIFTYIFEQFFNLPMMGKIISLPVVAVNGFVLLNYWVYCK